MAYIVRGSESERYDELTRLTKSPLVSVRNAKIVRLVSKDNKPENYVDVLRRGLIGIGVMSNLTVILFAFGIYIAAYKINKENSTLAGTSVRNLANLLSALVCGDKTQIAAWVDARYSLKDLFIALLTREQTSEDQAGKPSLDEKEAKSGAVPIKFGGGLNHYFKKNELNYFPREKAEKLWEKFSSRLVRVGTWVFDRNLRAVIKEVFNPSIYKAVMDRIEKKEGSKKWTLKDKYEDKPVDVIKDEFIPGIKIPTYEITNRKDLEKLQKMKGSVGSVVISGDLKSIKSRDFVGFFKLREVEILNGIQEIGQYAFSECKNLEEIVLPNSVKKIGDRAFEKCAGLKNITIPASVEKLGANIFDGCHKKDISIHGDLKWEIYVEIMQQLGREGELEEDDIDETLY